ncbi:1992_t:CDS:2 [Ambispora leptoticha]|uniref:1992_t:CDS:1 n=1 Tax=Ambispora leptoticha TaxID=144679 RepID=A0A9N8W188_9GLOM|nr:1992_t:CDS:2 [Ambispora leptoticha]
MGDWWYMIAHDITPLMLIISKYIGFSSEEIHLPITNEDKQLFWELIADQEEIIDVVMNEYRFLLHHGHNYKGGKLIHIM